MNNVEMEVRRILTDMFKINSSMISNEKNLFDVGLDSLTAIQLVVSLEETFGLTIEDDELLFNNFDTIHKILNIIEMKKEVS